MKSSAVGMYRSPVTLPSSDQALVGYPAGLGRRLGALVYDLLLVIAIWMGTLLVWVLVNNGKAVSGWYVQAVLIGEWIAFYFYFWSRRGQTLGMSTWRITLVDNQGLPPTTRQIMLRIVSAPWSLVCLGLGYLWIYVGSSKRTWHDLVSKTTVVHIPKAD